MSVSERKFGVLQTGETVKISSGKQIRGICGSDRFWSNPG